MGLEGERKKNLVHPTSNTRKLQEEGPTFVFTEGDGIYLKDMKGRKFTS